MLVIALPDFGVANVQEHMLLKKVWDHLYFESIILIIILIPFLLRLYNVKFIIRKLLALTITNAV